MSKLLSTAEGLATSTGVAILCATTNANVLQTGGWFTSHALLVAALSAGVFAGARVVGMGAGKLGLVIVGALLAGEAYNFSATAERIVVERENGAAPLRDAAAKHTAALAKLKQAEGAPVSSVRLEQAKADKQAKDDAVTKEASDGCKSECHRKQGLADKAQEEVVAATTEAEQMHQAAIDEAKAEVEANPLPASATPLADRLDIPAWALDLIMAGLLSVGANGLAGTLVAFGAHRPDVPDRRQTDFSPEEAERAVRFFRPDPPQSGPRNPDSPKKPGPSGGLTKAQALDDLMQRLADGRTIGSQDELASDWNRPKQTVSDWMREWRRIGVIPAATPAGRCKATVAG